MDKDLLDKIYKDTLEKPDNYHYVCYGGSSIKMVDAYKPDKDYKCRFQGDKNWMTPVCEKCTGLTSKEKALTDYQRSKNYGVTSLYDALLKTIK